jgi:hypothetical protein
VTVCSLVFFAVLTAAPSDGASEAKALARKSIVEYNGGDFEKALADVKQAYDLDPAPGLLYNIGQCHRALHHWEQAEFFFKGFLREKPRAPNRAAVKALVDEMEKNRLEEIAERKAAATTQATATPTVTAQPVVPEPVATPPPAPPPQPAPAAAVEAPSPGRHIPASTWVFGGIGLAAGIAGAVLWGLVASDRSGYSATGPEAPGVTYSAVQQSNTFALAGNILVPVGAGLIAIAAGIGIFGSSPAPAGAP